MGLPQPPRRVSTIVCESERRRNWYQLTVMDLAIGHSSHNQISFPLILNLQSRKTTPKLSSSIKSRISDKNEAPLGTDVTTSGVWLFAAQKPIEARLVERKVCFILDASSGVGGWTSVQRSTPSCPLKIKGLEVLEAEGGGYMQKQHSQRWLSSWNWALVVWSASSWLF